jgi:hypothetical protein
MDITIARLHLIRGIIRVVVFVDFEFNLTRIQTIGAVELDTLACQEQGSTAVEQ